MVIAGMSITDERKATYDFSNPYFQSGIQMAIAENNDSITSYKDLDGKTVVAKPDRKANPTPNSMQANTAIP